MTGPQFATAVATVIMRGLMDRVLDVVQPTVVPLAGIDLVSAGVISGAGVAISLYTYFSRIKSKDVRVTCSPEPEPRRKILDGRIHNESSSESRHCSICYPRHRRSRSRSLDPPPVASRDSVETIRRVPSSYSVTEFSVPGTSKDRSPCPTLYRYVNKSDDRNQDGSRSPSVYSVKSDDEFNCEDRDQGCGDCKPPRRRRRTRTRRKTRSGKVYSYMA